MVGKWTVLWTRPLGQLAIPRQRNAAGVHCAKREQDPLDRPSIVNPLEHIGDEMGFDVEGVVDSPECDLCTVDFRATFNVDAAKAPRPVRAEYRVGEGFVSNELVVMIAKVRTVGLKSEILFGPLAPLEFLTQPGSTRHQRLKVQLSVFLIQRLRHERL